MHVTKGHEKNDLGFVEVMVSGAKTITKRNPHHIVEALGPRTSCTTDLDRDIVISMKLKIKD